MCGIFGFFGTSNLSLLQNMSVALHHRGPDESNTFSDNICSLGIDRLAILDIEGGKQPFFSQNGNLAAVFNGEIYNFVELRKDLLAKGYAFLSDHSDAELIPHLYAEYGQDFAKKLNGMFAIAIYDKRKQELLLIRDRVGKKPLYYLIQNNVIYFASEIKALKTILNSTAIHFPSLISYLQKKNVSAPDTIYEDIYQIEPASTLIYNLKELKISKYWDINFVGTLLLPDIKDYTALLISELEAAVSRRMNMDVEFGSYLSGGLDSSLISAILVKKWGQKLKTFTLTYEDDLKNKDQDAHYARLMADILGTDHFEYTLSSKEVFNDISKVLGSFDEPFSGTISTYYLSKLISRHVKVAISGDGADELFGSYLTHRLSNPIEYLNSLNKIPAFEELSDEQKCNLIPFHSATEYQRLLGIYEKDNRKWRNKLLVFNPSEINKLFNKEINLVSEPTLSIYDSELNTTLESEFKDQLPNQILPFVDRLSMAHSVEVRSPFLDYKLVELVASFPSKLKINNGIDKYILKLAAAKYLPDDLINRKKEGFVLPVYNWIEDKYFTQVKATIMDSSFSSDLGMNTLYINSLLDDLAAKKTNHAKVWNLYNLAIWYNYIK